MKAVGTAVFLAAISLCACRHAPAEREIDAGEFSRHFARQRSCASYVTSLLEPISRARGRINSLADVRDWIGANPNAEFSRLVSEVERSVAVLGDLDPSIKEDQDKVLARVWPLFEKLAGANESGCGPSVKEVLADALMRALIPDDPAAQREFLGGKAVDPNELRWQLLTAVIAGSGGLSRKGDVTN